jgi:hypothetical protein
MHIYFRKLDLIDSLATSGLQKATLFPTPDGGGLSRRGEDRGRDRDIWQRLHLPSPSAAEIHRDADLI